MCRLVADTKYWLYQLKSEANFKMKMILYLSNANEAKLSALIPEQPPYGPWDQLQL